MAPNSDMITKYLSPDIPAMTGGGGCIYQAPGALHIECVECKQHNDVAHGEDGCMGEVECTGFRLNCLASL